MFRIPQIQNLNPCWNGARMSDFLRGTIYNVKEKLILLLAHIIYINSLGLSVTVTPDGQWPRTVV